MMTEEPKLKIVEKKTNWLTIKRRCKTCNKEIQMILRQKYCSPRCRNNTYYRKQVGI
jgi:hypothetical protein